MFPNNLLAEDILFDILDEYRIKQTREFFKCPLDIVKEAFKKVEATFSENEYIYYIENDINKIKDILNKIADKHDR